MEPIAAAIRPPTHRWSEFVPSLSRPSPEAITRGVYTLPERGPHDELIVVAIDSRGRRLYEAPVYRPGTEAIIVEALWTMLDVTDPVDLTPASARPQLHVL